MRIDLNNADRKPLYRVEVDLRQPPTVVHPPADAPQRPEIHDVCLDWDQAIDDEGHLRRCPVCGCRELFVRKDFPQLTGFIIVAGAAVVAMALFGYGQVLLGLAVLAGVALIDLLAFLFTGKCLVCYRCRSEFRDLPIRRGHPGWELAVGEKYNVHAADHAEAAGPGR